MVVMGYGLRETCGKCTTKTIRSKFLFGLLWDPKMELKTDALRQAEISTKRQLYVVALQLFGGYCLTVKKRRSSCRHGVWPPCIVSGNPSPSSVEAKLILPV
jgi:hypothetical protein